MLQEPITPLIIELTEPATEQISVGDVLMGAVSFAGVFILVGVALAVVFAGTLIALRRRRARHSRADGDMPGTRLGLHLPSG